MTSPILGIEEITYGATDLDTCRRFFTDWGLAPIADAPGRLTFECLNGCRVVVADPAQHALPPAIEDGPTLREVVWGVADAAALEAVAQRLRGLEGFTELTTPEGWRRVGATDPNGLAYKVQVTAKRALDLPCAEANTWARKGRIDQPAPQYERAQPIEVGHVVFFVRDLAACERHYAQALGFVPSDRYPGRGSFLRCAPEGGHHDLFLLQLPHGKAGLNHVAFTVRDIHEVFGGGLHFSRCGWDTQLGPGRHPISSAYFWYFQNPAGALVEYYADEDQLTSAWQPREFEPGPTVFAEWAVAGGLDGHTRRQKGPAEAPGGKFLTEKKG
jgi:catechol 2,3-dioxygenase-like lactoylglutathione lyase family enzyme